MTPATHAFARHLPALDGLRGIAITLVFAFHLGLLPGGFIGVDVFFTISGFLITRLLLREHAESGRIRLGRFWARRARRLLPALLLLLAGLSLFSMITHELEPQSFRLDALATLGYCANWRAIAIGSDYWEMFRRPSPLAHTWSLAIEEQYYLIWPVAVVAAFRCHRARRFVLWMALGIAFLSAGAMFALYEPNASTARIYYGTDTRAFGFALGSALAVVSLDGIVLQGRRVLDVAAAVGALALTIFAFTTAGGSPFVYRGGLFAMTIASLSLVSCTSSDQTGFVSRALSFAPLRMLGRISYGVYVWHWPIILVFGNHGRLAAVVVTIALATLSYVAVERPIRGDAFAGSAARFVALGAIAATVALVLASTVERPTPRRAQQSSLPTNETNRSAPLPWSALIVGDSVARSLGVSTTLFERLDNRGTEGCGLRHGSQRIRFQDGMITGRTDCGDWRQRWAADVAELDPDIVILTLAAPVIADIDMDGAWQHPCESAFDRKYQQLMEEALDVLSAKSAAVVVTLSPYVDDPTEGFVVPGSGTVQDFAVNRRRTDCVNDVVRAAVASRRHAEWVDLARRQCPSRACLPIERGIELRPDGTHYSPEGARIVMEWIAEELGRIPIRELRARAD